MKILLIYIVCYVIAYYYNRWLLRKCASYWGWEDVGITAVISLLTIPGMIIVTIIFIVNYITALEGKPPKWL